MNVSSTSGQIAEDEPASKKAKVAKKPENKPAVQEAHMSRSVDVPAVQLYPSNADAGAVPESQPYQDASLLSAPLAPPVAPVAPAPAVSSVSITRRDPRMARHTNSSVTVTYSAPEKTISSSGSNSTEAFTAPVSTPLMDLTPKLQLPMPPAPPPSVPKPAKTRCS